MPKFALKGRHGERMLNIELPPGVLILGRSSQCEIHIEDPAISRQHAELRVEENGAFVRDLGSMNGTFINGKRVEEESPLTPRDQVKFGHLVLSFLDDTTQTHTPLSPDTGARATLTTTYREIRDSARKNPMEQVLATVAEAGQILQKRMEIDEFYDAMLDLIQRSITASRILIMGKELRDGEPQILKARIIEGNPGEPLLMSATMLHRILEEGQSILSSDADVTKSMVAAGIHAALGAPLFDNDRILGAIYVDSRTKGVLYSAQELRLLTLLGNMLAVKITNYHYEKQDEVRREELAAAERIQRRFLPIGLPDTPGYDVFAFQEACQAVGGDLYDVRVLADGRIWFALGDVSGKGIGAALLMSSVMAGLQILSGEVPDPLTLVTRLEEYLEERIEYGQFITLFVGILDLATGEVNYVNAGHEGPMVLGEGSCEQLGTTGGAVALVPRSIRIRKPALQRTQERRILAPGQTLLVFSDGITETSYRGRQKELEESLYGELRMPAFLREVTGVHGKALGEALLSDLDEFRGDNAPHDDITLLILSRASSA